MNSLYNNKYVYSYTMSARQEGDEVLLGADIHNFIALDMSDTSPNVIKVLACFDAEECYR
ncbi:hypothetical protein BM1374165_01580 [Bartonella henselae]|uniref:Uncharacterized protein n=1 Tax=Bartonella henselae TaxID=38323 RepID=X5M958_BARHN|nr:hypothetical protein BM1374165_01580 [Bartonella henselae]